MSHAVYLDFLTAAVVLLSLIELDRSRMRWAPVLLSCCLAWNLTFFLAFKPLPGNSLAVTVLNSYCGKYTRYAVVNKWQPDVHDMFKPGVVKLPAPSL